MLIYKCTSVQFDTCGLCFNLIGTRDLFYALENIEHGDLKFKVRFLKENLLCLIRGDLCNCIHSHWSSLAF